MRQRFIEGTFVGHSIAKELNISTVTSWRYGKEFERIKAAYPEKLSDMNFYMPEPRQHWQTPLYVEFLRVLPGLLSKEKPGVSAKKVWQKYILINPNGYRYLSFTKLFAEWKEQNSVARKPGLLPVIPAEDLKVLKRWKQTNDHRRWQIAVALVMATQNSVIKEISVKIDSTHATVVRWLTQYKEKGLAGLELPKKERPGLVGKRMDDRYKKVVKLLHESPRAHGLNRTSWTITALTAIYNKVHKTAITWSQVSYTLKHNGYQFKKSRDVLTSRDPKFREKVNKIKRILQRLKPDEKFFSIDEYGPVGIRVRGGRILKRKDEAYDIPDKQRNKGVIICTAALELSTNQVTHFYSLKKNTFETIKMVELLAGQYADQRRIFMCWDNVSWHRSKILTNWVDYHNLSNKPHIILTPLPSSTQYLNVIESVFGGLARAVIHNSDYGCVDECKAAIDRHFTERNLYFQQNPKRAGKKIWGKEPVIPKFSDTQNCRNRHAMSGTK